MVFLERMQRAEHTQQALAEVNPHADVLQGLCRLTLGQSVWVVFDSGLQGVSLPLRTAKGNRTETLIRRPLSTVQRRFLTNTVLVAGLVSISLSDSVPLDWFKCGAILPAGPSPAVLLRSLSAPSVSPELLLIWENKTDLTSTHVWLWERTKDTFWSAFYWIKVMRVGCALPLCWPPSLGWCFSSGWAAQSSWLTLCHFSVDPDEK